MRLFQLRRDEDASGISGISVYWAMERIAR